MGIVSYSFLVYFSYLYVSKSVNMKQDKITLQDLISKVERILDTEIEKLPETLSDVAPEKRLEFVGKLLPVVIKYRADNSSLSDGWI